MRFVYECRFISCYCVDDSVGGGGGGGTSTVGHPPDSDGKNPLSKVPTTCSCVIAPPFGAFAASKAVPVKLASMQPIQSMRLEFVGCGSALKHAGW